MSFKFFYVILYSCLIFCENDHFLIYNFILFHEYYLVTLIAFVLDPQIKLVCVMLSYVDRYLYFKVRLSKLSLPRSLFQVNIVGKILVYIKYKTVNIIYMYNFISTKNELYYYSNKIKIE